MIRYSLRCAAEHSFESWFQSADAFDSLAGGGRVSCPVCGSTEVSKLLMAPAVRPARKAAAKPLSAPATKIEEAFQALRRQIEETSEYVGMNFVAEARKIHAGDAPERSIHGEARIEEARRLLEEGVPVAPLPFVPQRKMN
jgi:hypothetical protein